MKQQILNSTLTSNNQKNTNLTKELSLNLSQFGLCPFDWTIEMHDQKTAKIKNTTESDFQFIGKIDDTNMNWEYLKLLSI